MKKIFIAAFLLLGLTGRAQVEKGEEYPINPVQFTAVKVTDKFWGQCIKTNREITIPLAFKKCEETGRFENFAKAALPNDTNKVAGFPFDDADVYKTIEGASYSLQTYPDKDLLEYIDSLMVTIGAAQEADGYLYTARTMNPGHPHEWSGTKRWEKEEDSSHELYDLGYMLEGAVAHYQATGKRNFLDIAIKYADCVCREIGDKPEQACIVPGHEIAEMGLCRLYLATGDKKYLDEAKFFIDKRGYTAHKSTYNQTHKPILEQDEAVGHAVRAGYLYSGVTDVAALTGDTAYIKAIDRLWDNVVSRKLYLTGGIGINTKGGTFGKDYELPNDSAYCETCAAIANIDWNYRLFLLHGDAKYFDVLERTLYNGLISGISLKGDKFFHSNPLASSGGHCREPWFDQACCLSSISRFIPSLPGYIYAVKDDSIYVNLFMSNNSAMNVDGQAVSFTQTTSYPWNGDVEIVVSPRKQHKFTLKIRIPGWVQDSVVPSNLYTYYDGIKSGFSVTVNGDKQEGTLENGYFSIDRTWKGKDKVVVHFDLKPRMVKANPQVKDDRGRVAIERGPLVYCAESPDNNFDFQNILLSRNSKFDVESKSELLDGIDIIKTDAQSLSYDNNGKLSVNDVKLTLIPYYAWANRGDGKMCMWLPFELSATQISKPAAQ